jgi:hypothetical protein
MIGVIESYPLDRTSIEGNMKPPGVVGSQRNSGPSVPGRPEIDFQHIARIGCDGQGSQPGRDAMGGLSEVDRE